MMNRKVGMRTYYLAGFIVKPVPDDAVLSYGDMGMFFLVLCRR